MRVDPNVSIFQDQNRSIDPEQPYGTAQFNKDPNVRDSVDWDLDGRKRTQKIVVGKNKPSNQKLP